MTRKHAARTQLKDPSTVARHGIASGPDVPADAQRRFGTHVHSTSRGKFVPSGVRR